MTHDSKMINVECTSYFLIYFSSLLSAAVCELINIKVYVTRCTMLSAVATNSNDDTVYRARQHTPPGWTSEPTSSKPSLRRAHKTKMTALGRCGRKLSIEAPLDARTLSVVQEIGLETPRRRCALTRVTCTMVVGDVVLTATLACRALVCFRSSACRKGLQQLKDEVKDLELESRQARFGYC